MKMQGEGGRPTREQLLEALREILGVFPPVSRIGTTAGTLDLDRIRELVERDGSWEAKVDQQHRSHTALRRAGTTTRRQ